MTESDWMERCKIEEAQDAIATAFVQGKTFTELSAESSVDTVEAALRACLTCAGYSHYGEPVLTQRQCDACEEETHRYDCEED